MLKQAESLDVKEGPVVLSALTVCFWFSVD
jgi:hypothetical protein